MRGKPINRVEVDPGLHRRRTRRILLQQQAAELSWFEPDIGDEILQVKDLMSREVVTVRADQQVSDLFDILQAAHIKGAPVLCEEGTLIGFVSQEDVMFGSLGDEFREGGAIISEIMTSPAMSVTATTSVEDLARMMWRFRIHHMPVLDGEKLVGIVSSLDFCRVAAGLTENAEVVATTEEG